MNVKFYDEYSRLLIETICEIDGRMRSLFDAFDWTDTTKIDREDDDETHAKWFIQVDKTLPRLSFNFDLDMNTKTYKYKLHIPTSKIYASAAVSFSYSAPCLAVVEFSVNTGEESGVASYTVDWKQGKAEVQPFNISISTPDHQPKLFQSMWNDVLFIMLGDEWEECSDYEENREDDY